MIPGVAHGLHQIRRRQPELTGEACFAGLAAAYTAKGSYPEALALYEDAIKRAPHLTWLYTGRASVPLYVYGYHGRAETRPTPAEHRAYLERQGVTHVVLTGFGSGSDFELDALLGAYPGWLTVIHRWPGGRAALRVNRSGSAVDP